MVQQYLEHSKKILCDERAGYKQNRTGIDSISLFGYQNEYDLRKGFPLLTTKKMGIKTITYELMWFMKGESNIRPLLDKDVHIWDDNAFQYHIKKQGLEKNLPMYSIDWVKAKEEYITRIKSDEQFAAENGDLGPVYGRQWRHWKTSEGKEIDQFGSLIETLKRSPSSRRLIVSAWNPEEIPNMALPPCHVMYHINVQDKKMDLQLYQRSCDMFLGVPFNIASYAMLTQIIAQQAGLEPRRFIHTFGDSHFYCGAGKRGKFYGDNLNVLKTKVDHVLEDSYYKDILEWITQTAPPEENGREGQDHVTAILEQLQREPKPLPTLEIINKPYDQLTIEDFNLIEYHPYPSIKRAMAV